MSLRERQGKLSAQVNKYLINNPNILKEIPSGCLIVPVDMGDPRYFSYSMRIIKKAIDEENKSVLMAILLSGNKWAFSEFINF